MRTTNGLLFQQTREKLVREVAQSITDCVPEHPVRDFFLWSFSAANPERERWLHLIGISQTVHLTLKMLDGLVQGADAARLIDFSLPMCAYQFYEIVSDNLSIGLGGELAGDELREVRRELVLSFNQAMVLRLSGDARPAAVLLASAQPLAQQISLLQNTLNAGDYHKITHHYLAQNPAATLAQIDAGVWPLLVANIETCTRLARDVERHICGQLTVQGLKGRYEAVSALLNDPEMQLSRRVASSTDSILVIPTLAYFICVLKEIITPDAAIADSFSDGTLSEALYTAALLVRLLNDIGTPLLASAETRAQLLSALRTPEPDTDAGAPKERAFGQLLRRLSGQAGGWLTRLNKDLVHGECNICLFGLTKRPAARALPGFAPRLEFLAGLYAQSKQYLALLTLEVNRRLQDDRPMQLVNRFVQFHEFLYAQPYTESCGEYSG